MTNRWVILTLVVSALTFSGCGEEKPEESSESAGTGGSVVSAPVDYLGAVANAKKSSEGKLALAQLQQAIQYYQIENGKFPESLEALLASDHLTRMPKVPYKTKFVYDSKSGKVDLAADSD